MPQLRIQTLSKGARGLIFARQPAWTTVYSLKVDVPRKWFTGEPFMENLDFPSLSMTPLSVLILSRSHMLLSSDWQCLHSPHSPVNTGSTWSPTARSDTPSPTLSTTLRNEYLATGYFSSNPSQKHQLSSWLLSLNSWKVQNWLVIAISGIHQYLMTILLMLLLLTCCSTIRTTNYVSPSWRRHSRKLTEVTGNINWPLFKTSAAKVPSRGVAFQI